jgi:Mrp family chromosome partitioning ATPase
MGSRREAATEFFTSIRMRLFLDAVKHRYPDRFVFIDSAAIGETADAKILADLADFVVVVVPYGGVTEQQVEKAVAAVAPQKLVGIIMNDEPAW